MVDQMQNAQALTDRDPRNDNMPYGLRDALVYGFDASTWRFKSRQIFVPTFSSGEKSHVLYKGSEVYYDIPDGTIVKGSHTASDHTESVMFRGRELSDDRDFLASVSASLGIDGVSVSTSNSIETASKISQKTDTTTTLISQYKSIYEFYRNAPGLLTEDFASELKGLPTNYDPSNAANTKAFSDFFRNWGTHYLIHGFWRQLHSQLADLPARRRHHGRSDDQELDQGELQ